MLNKSIKEDLEVFGIYGFEIRKLIGFVISNDKIGNKKRLEERTQTRMKLEKY